MKKIVLVLLLGQSIQGYAEAVDTSNRITSTSKFGNWSMIEFSLPETVAYRIGVSSKLTQQQAFLMFTMFPPKNCKPDDGIFKLHANLSVAEERIFKSHIPSIVFNYQINGGKVIDTIVTPEFKNNFMIIDVDTLGLQKIYVMQKIKEISQYG